MPTIMSNNSNKNTEMTIAFKLTSYLIFMNMSHKLATDEKVVFNKLKPLYYDHKHNSESLFRFYSGFLSKHVSFV